MIQTRDPQQRRFLEILLNSFPAIDDNTHEYGATFDFVDALLRPSGENFLWEYGQNVGISGTERMSERLKTILGIIFNSVNQLQPQLLECDRTPSDLLTVAKFLQIQQPQQPEVSLLGNAALFGICALFAKLTTDEDEDTLAEAHQDYRITKVEGEIKYIQKCIFYLQEAMFQSFQSIYESDPESEILNFLCGGVGLILAPQVQDFVDAKLVDATIEANRRTVLFLLDLGGRWECEKQCRTIVASGMAFS